MSENLTRQPPRLSSSAIHGKILHVLKTFDAHFGAIWYILLAVIPILSAALRPFNADIPYVNEIITYLVIMLAALSGSYTEKFNEHLRLDLRIEEKKSQIISVFLALRDYLGAFILFQFFFGSLELLFVAFSGERILEIIPVQVFIIFIPLGFFKVLWQWIKRTSKPGLGWLYALTGIISCIFGLPSILNILYNLLPNIPEFLFTIEGLWYTVIPPLVPILIVVTLIMLPLGLPLYLILGGIAMLFFLRDGIGASSVMYEGITVLGTPAIPAIALFTLTGYLLSESKASQRLVKVFLSLFGWFPGGVVFATVVVLTVFTTFTGASGVTILALGGLLFSALSASGHYPEKFSYGLVTSAGSNGLLFPPSLAMILYGSIAQINILHIFLAGIIPGTILLLSMSIFGIIISYKSHKQSKIAINTREIVHSIKDAIWELLIPVVILGLYFSGISTILEASAIAVLYTLFVEFIIKRELTIASLKEIVGKSMRIVGGILFILMLAKGLSALIVDAQIPQNFASFVQSVVSSRIVFLLLLNLSLIITGMLMDIYSAILVVVPIILPLGTAFGIDPIHLGMIFLVNLELGFMTPPVGINLFLSSYRFSQPLNKIYKSIIPFMILEFVFVMVITFIPELSLLLVPK